MAYDDGMTKAVESLTAQLRDISRAFCLEVARAFCDDPSSTSAEGKERKRELPSPMDVPKVVA